MSRLRTGSLEGRDNNKIDFAANQTLQIDGRMDLGNGTYLQMPTWDNANRPASPQLSSIGYNTELLSMEIYSGTDPESGELIGDAGWQVYWRTRLSRFGNVYRWSIPTSTL